VVHRLLTGAVVGVAVSAALSIGGPIAASGTNTGEGQVGAVALVARGEPLPSYVSVLGHLGSGQSMQSGDTIKSMGGHYQLIMQKEGNLVLYNADNKPVWASPTDGNPGARVDMQKEGNLVIYSAANKPVWTSPTAGNAGASLQVRDDGHLAIVGADGRALWTTP
jgi:hypothetical protein